MLRFILVGALCLVIEVVARPAEQTRDAYFPKLSDTLSVAKSPLEPITLAPSLPGGRNNDLPDGTTTTITESKLGPDEATSAAKEHKQQENKAISVEPELSEASTPSDRLTTANLPMDATVDRTNLTELSTTSPVPKEFEGSTDKSAIESSEPKLIAEVATTTTANNPEPAGVVTVAGPVFKEEEKSVESTTREDNMSTLNTTTTEASKETSAEVSSEKPEVSTVSYPKLDEPVESGKFKGASSLGQPISLSDENRERPVGPVSEAPETTTSAPELSSHVPEREQPAETTALPTTTTTMTMITTTTTTEAPTTTSSTTTTTTTTPAPETTTTTTQAPSTSVPTTTSTAASMDSTTNQTTSSSTSSSSATIEKPVQAELESEKKKDEKRTRSACNHLPTYGSDEIQKVFREETTFRNGTIRGKFTYINFDQRYRLVHYTRLPYGPVKIDQVEELGKPDGSSNNSGAPLMGDIPNAVLQLRNLLPTSLFGFPFLGSNSGSSQLGLVVGPREGNDDDRSNMYFYSTESLATPNMLNQRMPVSLLPGHRFKQQTQSGSPPTDTLTQSYLEQPLGSSPQLKPQYSMPATIGSDALKPKLAPVLMDQNQETPRMYQRQLHYPNPEQAKDLSHDYFAPHMPAVNYQPLPLYQSPPVIFSYDQPKMLNHQQLFNQQNIHQAHQPHNHEHFVAPFMFAKQPSSFNGDINENSRLRLKVKTSKALHSSNTGSKSAQLRLQPDEQYSPPANSPLRQQARPRQRLGKQNHELKTTNSHNLPVVYHVLRSPAGRTFTIPQPNQGYAIAYDQDD